ncbi:phage baseplate assembly protein V [Paenibacillus hamazuiensis]|uniref:phage baseplate assembly protein V n=1 Tax=Paenibacillus hamazuiensis TaxID=2936508 RepID=UPI00200BFAA1|nr:phage baseplate assembly protein V [Paenibacillus hamazuiensis]
MSVWERSFPASERTYQKAEGVMVAIVTNNQDPDGLGRVKLKLPLRETENETDWTRIATLMAGNDRGSYFVPEVGDEVLVAFHLGEIRQPYVIGTLWSPTQKAPKGDDKNNLRKIRSRAGHELTFDDTDSAGKITITTTGGTKIVIDDKADSIELTDKNGKNKIEIKGGSANEIALTSQSTTIKMTGQGEVTVSSPKSIALKAAQVTVEASATLSLKGGASVDINSDGMVNIKGSMVKIN